MDSVSNALKSLDASIAKKKPKERKRLAEIAGHASSHLVLLKLQYISPQITRKLSSFLRESLAVLYASVDLPALHLASVILQSVYHERLLPTIGNMQRDQQDLWESVLHALLAGLLDYLDDHDTREVKEMIGSALYPSLCEVCFSLSAPKTNVDLRSTAYNILSDSAASHPPNQERLRDKDVLGGERLGSCIWRTKDYVAVEGLLNLFARALPSTHNTPSGRSRRTAYIHSVFRSCAPPDATATSNEIIELLENVPTSSWDDTALKIVDVLARGNISCPQPFAVAEVTACSHVYRSDRLYADDKVLLVNVLLGDDQYESLKIAYSSIQHIDIIRSVQDNVRVTVFLRELPRLGKDHITTEKNIDAAPNLVVFALKAKDVPRLVDVFQSRGLSHALRDIPGTSQQPHVPKLSLAAEPANLELDSTGRFVKELSQTERIENVSQLYRTNEPSDPIMSSGDASDFRDTVHVPSSPCKPTTGLPPDRPPSVLGAKLSPALTALSQTKLKRVAIIPSERYLAAGNGTTLARADSHLIRAAAFGLSDEELSEISDYDSPVSRSKILRRSSTSTCLVRGRISFQPLLSTSTGTSSSATRVARGGVGKVVLDSDDDSPPVAPISPAFRRAKRKAALIRDPTLDDSQPASLVLAPASPAPPVLPAITIPEPIHAPIVPDTPVTPFPLLGDAIPVSSNGPEKVLRFSDIPAPNFNVPLSSPAVVPRSLKSALVKKLSPSRLANAAFLESALSVAESVPLATASEKDLIASAIKASDMLDDLGERLFLKRGGHNPTGLLAPPSSSPTPGAKKSIRSRLRKKDENSRTTRKPSNTTSMKRKSTLPDDPEDLEPLSALSNDTSRPAKRARIVAPPTVTSSPKAKLSVGESPNPRKGILDERSESQLLRPRATATTRATKRYHAKKGRASSPVGVSNTTRKKRVPSVDYDALPSPPRPYNAPVTLSSPIPKGKPVAKSKPKAPVKAEVGRNSEKEVKARKTNETAAMKKPAGAVPARKAHIRAPKNAEQEMGETRAGKDTAPIPVVDRPSVAPEVPESRRPQRAQHEKAPAAVLVKTHDRDADVELPPVDDYVDVDDVVFTATNFSDIDMSQVDCDDPKPSIPSVSKQRRDDDEGRAKNPVDLIPITASKESSATPWDVAALQNVYDIPSGVEEEPRASPGVPMMPSAEVEHMEVNDGGLSKPQQSPVECLPVSSEPAFRDGLATYQRARQATSEPQPQKRTSTIPKKLDAASSARHPPVSASKVASVPSPTVVKAETIDLTLDSPPRLMKLAAVPVRERMPPPPSTTPERSAAAKFDERKQKFILEEDDDADILAFMKQARKAHLHKAEVTPLPARVFSPKHEDTPLPILDRRAGVPQRRLDQVYQMSPNKTSRERGAVFGREDMGIHKNNSSLDGDQHRLIDILGRLHDTVVCNIENKFAGVRHHARLGRNKLVRDAVADLVAVRAESVAQFNKLVDLEAEYATSGRGLIHGSEDWLKTNRELNRSLTQVLEQHDRTMLSKRMPPTLITSML